MHDIFVVPVHAGAQLSAQWRTFAFIQFVASAVARVEFSIPQTFSGHMTRFLGTNPRAA